MAQLVTRVDDDLATAVDELIAAGVVASRSEAVRLGLQRLVDRYRRDEVGARIVAGYGAVPQEDNEGGWSDESTVGMIAEEPW
jgi:Arc/MetJ-type ribon-helix-helix transcriptional regulator